MGTSGVRKIDAFLQPWKTISASGANDNKLILDQTVK